MMNKELSFLEACGSHSGVVGNVYSYLLTVKPTTIELKRAFSSSALPKLEQN